MDRRSEGGHRYENDPGAYKGASRGDPAPRKSGKIISKEDVEADMLAAVKETERESKSRGSWFRSSSNEPPPRKLEVREYGSKKNVVIPGMKDIGKEGAEAPSYTQLFAAKQKQRQKGRGSNADSGSQQDEPSPAAAIFAPDDDVYVNDDTPASYTQLLSAEEQKKRQGRGGSHLGRKEVEPESESEGELYNRRGGADNSRLPPVGPLSAGTTPVPASAKDEGVRAWLDQVTPPQPESDDDVPTANPVSVREDRFAEVSEGGSMPPFPSHRVDAASKKAGVSQVDADQVEPLPDFFRKPKTATTNMKYTDQFNKGTVPTFPTNKEATQVKVPIVEEEPKPRGGCECSIL